MKNDKRYLFQPASQAQKCRGLSAGATRRTEEGGGLGRHLPPLFFGPKNLGWRCPHRTSHGFFLQGFFKLSDLPKSGLCASLRQAQPILSLHFLGFLTTEPEMCIISHGKTLRPALSTFIAENTTNK